MKRWTRFAALVGMVLFVVCGGAMASGSKDESGETQIVGDLEGLGTVSGSQEPLTQDSFPQAPGIAVNVPDDNPYSWAARAAADQERRPSDGTKKSVKATDREDAGGRRKDHVKNEQGRKPERSREEMPSGGRGTAGPSTSRALQDIGVLASDRVEGIDFPLTVMVDLSSGGLSVLEDVNGVGATDVTLTSMDNGLRFSSKSDTPVRLVVTGDLAGTLRVSSRGEGDLAVVLDGADIRGTDGPALAFEGQNRVFLVIGNSSTNVLEDSQQRSHGNREQGSLVAAGPLIITAEDGNPVANENSGTLSVTGNYMHGIDGSDYVRIRSGMMLVETSARDGIHCVSGFAMDGGDVTVVASGTTQGKEGQGINVVGRAHSRHQGEGTTLIQDGRLTITSVGRGLSTGKAAQGNAVSGRSTDSDITINGGIVDVVTTGIPSETVLANGSIISSSPEGIAASSNLVINGGMLRVRTSDAALYAGKSISINGGLVYGESTMMEAICSEGKLLLNGGVVTAIGADGAESALSSSGAGLQLNGGLMVGLGGENISLPDSTSRQRLLVIYDQVPVGNIMEVRDQAGNTLFSYLVPVEYQAMVVSCPGVQDMESYTIYDGDTPLSTATTKITSPLESSVTFFGTAREWDMAVL